MQSLSMVDMPMCRAGQWWISPCVELVNGGYAHVRWWSMFDMACVELVNVGYTHVQWWSMLDMACAVVVNGGYAHVQ